MSLTQEGRVYMSKTQNCLLARTAGFRVVIAGWAASAGTGSSAPNSAAFVNSGGERSHRRQRRHTSRAPGIRKSLLAIACSFVFASCDYATASAAPVVLTWNPSASAPPLSSTTGAFSFDNATIQDYTSLYLTPTSANTFSVTDIGFLPLVAFTNGATNTTPAALNSASNPNPFGLYGAFTSTSTLTCTGGSAANCTGTTSSLNLSLIGDPGYNTTFAFDPVTGNPVATDPTSNDFLLATGSLANCGVPSPTCQNMVGQTNGIPSAAVTTTFVPEPSQLGFFVSPASNVTLNLLASFINNVSQVVCYDNLGGAACDGQVTYGGPLPSGAPAGADVLFQIGNTLTGLNPGGGSATFLAVVPEPASLGLFGPALIALWAFARRCKRCEVRKQNGEKRLRPTSCARAALMPPVGSRAWRD